LLSIFGKIYERILVNRMQLHYNERHLDNAKQFGFKSKKSTEDAFLYLRQRVLFSEEKYIIAFFIDIEGAFDSLWWPAIIARLIKFKCSSHLIAVLDIYFSKRIIKVRSKCEEIKSTMKRGCPQDSIISPATWNWAMDDLLSNIEIDLSEDKVEVFAYADDLAILIKANSRRERRSRKQSYSKMENWCALYKLKVYATKTITMIVKGKFNRERPPIFKIDGANIKYGSEIRYLGLILDERLNLVQHAKYLRNKLVNLIMSIRRIAREKWGIKTHIVDTLYKVVALPIVTYAAGWFDKVGHSLVQRHLIAMQRALLLVQTKACRTTSMMAMQVLHDKVSFDLEIAGES